MSSSLASSSSKSKWSFQYDVFLTLRDPTNPVKTYLENSFREAGITTFIDDQTIMKEKFSVQETVERCSIVMVVFTEDWLESWVFQKRLVNILKCHETMNKPVVPVFYGVNSEQVLEHLAYFDPTKSAAWELFLLGSRSSTRGGAIDIAAASLSSFTLSSESDFSINDGKEIRKFVTQLYEYLFRNLPRQQVGLQPRLREVLALLEGKYVLFEDPIIVGIWGAEGIGKTTFVRDLYDKIGCNFESKSFLANIEGVWEKANATVLLQKQLVSDISGSELDETNDVEVTLEQVKQVLYRRALVVLDDVNQVDQFTALCGRREWFGEGSIVLITTRNKDILDHFVNKTYEMKTLDINESLSLFSWHAFKKFSPTIDFVNLSRNITTFCEGLPLVLEVFGSLLHSRTKLEWKIVLNKLKIVPKGQIQQKLKISLDFLTDLEKDLFFNISCFYVGQSEEYVTQLLKGSRFPVEIGMPIIIERSLIKVMNGKIHVHDLLQEMGREIDPNKPKLNYTYDVFLSFRGEDTRKSFTSHLYTALKQSGIKVFMDEGGIERGENISSSLLQAIESSRMSIIVFSKTYAGSSWCLQELEKIMECHKATSHEVFPIFYDVQPSEVRKQQNAFGKAWKRLMTRKKLSIINSQRALTEAANLSGWDMQKYSTESELIDHVVETITMKIDDKKSLFVAQHPVGLKHRIQDIIQLLSCNSNEVVIAGIWGMGGIGKTTIAKAIYNEVGQSFLGKSFLANVREAWKQNNGQIYLQEQLLSGILKSRRITLPNIEMGKNIVKETLSQKRVLVVLDDVNNEDQLKALCGSREWFGRGSRIIITTRDERLLKILRVVHVYSTKEMDENESFELFSWHAFKQPMPEQDFIEFSRRVVSYSGGLPLALEIIGSYLFDKEIPIWESVLEKLQRIPNDQIYEKLKISYDGLSDHTEKDIFLDICCFFVGKDRSYATQILDGCGLYAKSGISRLLELSLVKVGSKNKLEMHDLLRDMGREIIREKSPDEPEKRTRLWFHEDVLDVLRNNIGTIAIKGLALSMSRKNSLSLNTKVFQEMKRLHLLQLDHVQLSGNYGYLSKQLRWFCFQGFSLESIPMNICLEKIVGIDLKWSRLTKVWEKSQLLLEWLKILNMSHSHYLIETPNFSRLPYLEKLILKDCSSLCVIHPSIGDLKHIVLLNLKDCKSLNHLPRSVYKLKSLKTLNLFGCSKIEKLEEDIEQMESLTTLVADQTAITKVPFSLVRLKSIKHVSICGYEGSSLDIFPSLVLSWMTPRNHSKFLFRTFGIMPFLIKGLSLFAKSQDILQSSRPSTSQALHRKAPPLLGFDHDEQVTVERSEIFMSSLTIHVGGFNEAINTLLKNISQGWNDGGMDNNSLPRDNFPDWLRFENEESSISFKVPQVVGRCLKGMVFYIVYSSSLQDNNTTASAYPVSVMIKNFTKATIEFYRQQDAATIYSEEDDEWRKIISNLEPENEVEVIVNFAHKYIIKKTAIYLVYVEELTNKPSISK